VDDACNRGRGGCGRLSGGGASGRRKRDASPPVCGWRKNTFSKNTTDITQKITGTPMGEMTIKIRQIQGVWEQPERADNGKTKVVLTFDRIVRDFDMAMASGRFDTDDPKNEDADPQLEAISQPMIGASLSYDVDKSGKLVSFSGMQAIHDKIAEGATANMYWMQMQQRFTDDVARKEWAETPLGTYPNRKVKVGDTWTATLTEDVPRLGKLTTNYRYKLDRIRRQDGHSVAVISISGTMSLAAPKTEGDKSVPEFKGSVSGSAIYDIRSGMIVSRTGDSTATIKMPAPMGGEGRFVNIDITTHDTSRVLAPDERAAQKRQARKKAARQKEDEAASKTEDKP